MSTATDTAEFLEELNGKLAAKRAKFAKKELRHQLCCLPGERDEWMAREGTK